jgi:hypothetical protein
MIPSTGSTALDVVFQLAIIAAMVVLIVMLIKNYFRDR